MQNTETKPKKDKDFAITWIEYYKDAVDKMVKRREEAGKLDD